MAFSSPEYGWFMFPIVALLLAAIWNETKAAVALRRLADTHLLDQLIPREQLFRRVLRVVLPFIPLMLLTLCLMRPQWGTISDEETTTGLDVLVALDLSKSMLADDLSPSRLSVAVRGIERLLGQLKGDRIGLVAFAGSAFQLSPLTSDHAIIGQILKDLDTSTIPKGGSSLASALNESKRAFRGTPKGGRVLILVTDGEDHEGKIAPALADVRQDGIAVYAVLVGTNEGGVIPLGSGQFVKDRTGAVVKSRVGRETIATIDPATTFMDADGNALARVLAQARTNCVEQARKRVRPKLEDRFQIPLAAALLVWTIDLFLRSRRRRS